jgi:predicted RNase H-like HicB family nuclease
MGTVKSKNCIFAIMKTLEYIIYKEGKHFVSQCLNVEVSSFGNSIEDAAKNLKESLDLYFEDDHANSVSRIAAYSMKITR